MAKYSIDQEFLEEVGISIADKAARDAKIDQLTEALEIRVGNMVAEHLTKEQIDEFEKQSESNTADENIAWLEKAYPGYKEVVAEAFEALKEDIKAGRI